MYGHLYRVIGDLLEAVPATESQSAVGKASGTSIASVSMLFRTRMRLTYEQSVSTPGSNFNTLEKQRTMVAASPGAEGQVWPSHAGQGCLEGILDEIREESDCY